MKDKDRTFYQKLVDLYANRELPTELENELVQASTNDPLLAKDMETLRQTVLRLQAQPNVDYNEDTHYRIMMKLQAWGGVDIMDNEPTQIMRQYRLPMEG